MIAVGVVELAIVGASLAVPLTIVFAGVRSVQRGGRSGNAASAEDSQLMQELFQGMKRMEARVESLETILLEKGRPE